MCVYTPTHPCEHTCMCTLTCGHRDMHGHVCTVLVWVYTHTHMHMYPATFQMVKTFTGLILQSNTMNLEIEGPKREATWFASPKTLSQVTPFQRANKSGQDRHLQPHRKRGRTPTEPTSAGVGGGFTALNVFITEQETENK